MGLFSIFFGRLSLARPVFAQSWCFGLSSPIVKNILVSMFVRNTLSIQPSRPNEGHIAILTDAGRDAMDASRAAQGQAPAGQGVSICACELFFKVFAVWKIDFEPRPARHNGSPVQDGG
jgi:hypothetical protein